MVGKKKVSKRWENTRENARDVFNTTYSGLGILNIRDIETHCCFLRAAGKLPMT